MKIEQITDPENVSCIKQQLGIDGDAVIHTRTEDNGNQYMLVQCGDGRSFLFSRDDNLGTSKIHKIYSLWKMN